MNWRHEIKAFFADQIQAAIGDDLKLWGAWNSQYDSKTDETFGDFAVFFEYVNIEPGLAYLQQAAYQRADRVPVNVTLHLVFNNQSEQHQDLAFDYAHAVIQKLAGKKHPVIHGQISKIGELEDNSHEVQYDYQITFAMQIKEFYVCETDMTNANPDDEDGNPLTGRRIKFDIMPEIR